MNSKSIVKTIGGVGTIISGVVDLYSAYQFSQSKALYEASSFFGSNNNGARMAFESMNNYKFVIIVSSIILLVSIILLISGFIFSLPKNEDDLIEKVNLTQNIPEQIQSLSKLKDEGIITEQEFIEKKKELLAKL